MIYKGNLSCIQKSTSKSCHKRFLCCITNQSTELDSGYVPHKVEGSYKFRNHFKPPKKDIRPFTLILPPPNITGTLHLGHALTATVQDVIIRWKQMQGIETIWVPGIDHAGIATQTVVEKLLWKEAQQTKHDLGRSKFIEKVNKWKNEKGGVIGQQLRDLGVLLDWNREIYTLDEQRSLSVQKAFIQLFDAGLIYRADSLVNWSCNLRSAISDIEVEQLPISGSTQISVPGYEKSVEFGVLMKFAYKLDGTEDEIVVTTTRPETIPGDVAVAVHPEDDRYSKFVGRFVKHPFRQDLIPVIADSFVNRDFGTDMASPDILNASYCIPGLGDLTCGLKQSHKNTTEVLDCKYLSHILQWLRPLIEFLWKKM